jgi:type II secretory pathway component PulC
MELRFSQRHVTALNFLLIAGLAYFAAQCVNDIVKRTMSTDSDAPSAASIAPRSASGVRTRTYYDTIVKRDIFNLVPQNNAPAPVVAEDLHLKLLGTSLLSKSQPYAILEDQAGNQSLYQVGQDVPDAGRLVSVEPNRAIIDRGGRRVAIDLPPSEIPEAAPSHLGGPIARTRGAIAMPHVAIPNNIPDMMQRHMRRHRPPAAAEADDDDSGDDNSDDNSKDDSKDDSKLELKKLGPGRFEAKRTEVANTMQNPAQLFAQMRALPHFVNGKTDGFSISNVAAGSVFEQLGLQNGDLLTEIDGKPVTNPMQAMGLMTAVQTASSIDLTIQRGGSPTKVHLDLR